MLLGYLVEKRLSLEPCGVMLRGECWGKLVLGAWCRQAVLCGNRGLTETEIKGK